VPIRLLGLCAQAKNVSCGSIIDGLVKSQTHLTS
jgi:hypothetical protein